MKNFVKISAFLLTLVAVSSGYAQLYHSATDQQSTGARSARSSVSVAKPQATVQETAPATVAPTSTRSARTARASATSTAQPRPATVRPTAGRSARGSLPANSVRAVSNQPVPVATTQAPVDTDADNSRSGVSRAGISAVPVVAPTTQAIVEVKTTTTATTQTPMTMAEALKKAGITGESGTVKKAGLSKEELAVKISDEQTCRTEYNNCMDNFCKDTAEDSILSRCLCSGSMSSYNEKENEREHLLATINQLNAQITYLPLAQQKATLEGKEFNTALTEVTIEQLEKLGLTTAKKDNLEDMNIYDVYLGEVSNTTVRKEGNSLLKEAQKNCSTILELCPSSSKVVQSSYSTLVGNDCRAYEKGINGKLKELTMVQQNAFNKYQIEVAKYDVQTNNKYNAEQCSTELYTCMSKDQNCGADFKKCYNESILTSLRINCQSVLNQCRSANMPPVKNEKQRSIAQTDIIWKSFVKNALSRGQLSNQDCFAELTTCMSNDAVCGEGYKDCYNENLLTSKRVACNDIFERCRTQDTTIWDTFVKTALSRSQLSAEQCYKQSKTCVIEECGADFSKCLSAGTKAVKTDAKFLSDIQGRAKTACGDTILRCANSYESTTKDVDLWAKSATDIENAIWSDIINQMIDDNVNDLSETEAYNQLVNCMKTACGGDDFKDCRNRTMMDDKKISCITQLNRTASPEKMYNNFAKATLNKYGYTEEECGQTVKNYLDQNCGEGYSGCNSSTIEQIKIAATNDAASMCEWDIEMKEYYVHKDTKENLDKTDANKLIALKLKTGEYLVKEVKLPVDTSGGNSTPKLNSVWKSFAESISKQGDETLISKCKAQGEMYDFDNANKLCVCKYGQKDNGTCRTKEEYDEFMKKLGAELSSKRYQACVNAGGLSVSGTCYFKLTSFGWIRGGILRRDLNETRQKYLLPGAKFTCNKVTMGFATDYGCTINRGAKSCSTRRDRGNNAKRDCEWAEMYQNGATVTLPKPAEYKIEGEEVKEVSPAVEAKVD